MIGDLRVWWIPQIPMKAFRVPVETPKETKKLLNTLANYDLFQLKNHIKPDFSNAGGLEVEDEDGWSEWYDYNGFSIDEVEE